MRNDWKSGRAAGFTLLEVVVATAVLAIGVAVAMQVFSGGLRNLHRIDMAHRAMSHAENVMSELLADQDIRGPYHSNGDLDDDFYYEAAVDYWDDPNPAALMTADSQAAAPPVYLLKIGVVIHFKDDPNQRIYRATCLKAVTENEGEEATGEVLQRIFGRRQ